MNHLLRLRIWPSFLASSGIGPCDVPFRYVSDQSRGTAGRLPGTRRKRLRCAWHAHLRGLATEIHEISGLVAVRRESVLLVWADWSYFVYLGVFDNFPKTVRLDVDPWTTVSDRTRIVGRIVLAQSRFSGIDPTQLGVG
jgi:hypothetical protein